MQLGDVLPAGWRERVERLFEGQALVLNTLGRPDLLKSKLFALCDRGTDLPDCVALAPTAEELGECLPWLELQDGNELWPDHVRATIAKLGRRLSCSPRSLGWAEDDLRVLSVLTTWLGVHRAHVNADRLVRLVSEQPSERVRAYWAAIAQWLHKDRRFARRFARSQIHWSIAGGIG